MRFVPPFGPTVPLWEFRACSKLGDANGGRRVDKGTLPTRINNRRRQNWGVLRNNNTVRKFDDISF